MLSFDRNVLDWVVPQLVPQLLQNPAQIHLDISDLSQTKLAWAINALGFQHARNVSIGNTAFMQSLARQLRVPPQDCLKIAEQLIDANFSCPLQGQYKLQRSASGRQAWVSTAWSGKNEVALSSIPADYIFPVMKWFRGMNAQALVRPDILSIQINLLMKRHPKTPAFSLPNLFKSPPDEKAGQPKPVKPDNQPDPKPEPEKTERLPVPKPILPAGSEKSTESSESEKTIGGVR